MTSENLKLVILEKMEQCLRDDFSHMQILGKLIDFLLKSESTSTSKDQYLPIEPQDMRILKKLRLGHCLARLDHAAKSRPIYEKFIK